MLVNMLDAKTQLSKLVEAALRGEEVIIANRGKPMVKLVPAEAPAAPRAWGVWEGQLSDAHLDAAFSPEADAAMADDLLGYLQQRAVRVAEPRPAYKVTSAEMTSAEMTSADNQAERPAGKSADQPMVTAARKRAAPRRKA